jgi:hypothetical protein
VVFTGEAAKVERAFRASLDAYERKDANAVLALESAKRLATPSGSPEAVSSFADAYRIILYRINKIVVTGGRATLDYEDAIVGRNLQSNVTTLLGQHDVWVKEGNGWVNESGRASTPGIPSDVATVKATLSDGAPITIPNPLPTTDFAFLLKNTGDEAKGLFILGVPADLDAPAFIQRQATVSTPGFADGIQEMGATLDIPAHANGTMVFSGQLPQGRYLLLTTSTHGEDRTMLTAEYADFTVR